MTGDYTRFTFNPLDNYLGVLMQQGRVLLDAEFNELIEILDRRFRAETTDIIGRCVVPRETPEGFEIQISGSTITIGRGRMYVDGLLAENHGQGPLEYDPILGGLRGTLPVPYNDQPYFPNAENVAPFPGTDGPHLVYIDVWKREVTSVEKPELVEKAVGVDTTTRLQTVWQVKVIPNVDPAVNCATPVGDIPQWVEETRSSAGRLTTAAQGVPASTDPCIISPAGGFRGTENRLYRVEIHAGGPQGSATFKWSRDNGSVATGVTGINAGLDQLTVVRTGRDPLLRFEPGDWIEITDDWHEFAGQPGDMRKVQLVDDVAQTITLETALTTGEFNQADASSRHTRIRRWDQKGLVLDSNNNVIADVDASGGVIPIPPAGPPVSIVLEDGVQVTFSTNPAVGDDFRTADYWAFHARTVDASVEVLTEAPPRGILHHYCRLAVVTFPNTVASCRVHWPPEVAEGCDCSVCVTAESHNCGTLTIQMAIDQVLSVGGKVCLGPGIYELGQTPVQIHGAQSVELKGHGWRTALVYNGDGPAMSVLNSLGVNIGSLSLLALSAEAGNLGIALHNSVEVNIEHCFVLQLGVGERGGTGIGLSGFLAEIFIRNNLLFGAGAIESFARDVETGVADATASPAASRASQPLAAKQPYLASFGLYVEDNLIGALQRGVSLQGLSFHIGETRISGNCVYGCSEAGIVSTGLVLSPVFTSSRIDINGNELLAWRHGIIVGNDNARIRDNDIGVLALGRGRNVGEGNGIVLTDGIDRTGMDRCQVLANRITGLGGNGISLQAHVRSAVVNQNTIEGVGGQGIVIEEGGRSDRLTIENNQLLHIAPRSNNDAVPVVGIRITQAGEVAVASNTITDLGRIATASPSRVGIQVVSSASVRIAGNELSNIGPPGDFVQRSAGIEVEGPFDRLDVVDNVVRRNQNTPERPGAGLWNAVRILQPTTGLLFRSVSATIAQPDATISTTPVGSGTVADSIATPASAARAARDSAEAVAAKVVFPAIANVQPFVLVGLTEVTVLPGGREIVALRGNLLEAFGEAPDVEVFARGACVFSDNRCLLTSSSDSPSVAIITAGAIIASANYLQGPPSAAGTVANALQMTVGQGPFTVLGNVASGAISVNGSPLPAPWSGLNQIVT